MVFVGESRRGAGVNGGTAPVQINQDASIRVSELDAGTSLPLTVPEGRQAYLLCMEGAVDDAGGAVGLERHDAAELSAGASLNLIAGAKARAERLLVMEM